MEDSGKYRFHEVEHDAKMRRGGFSIPTPTPLSTLRGYAGLEVKSKVRKEIQGTVGGSKNVRHRSYDTGASPAKGGERGKLHARKRTVTSHRHSKRGHRIHSEIGRTQDTATVSYTHLTLPTKA